MSEKTNPKTDETNEKKPDAANSYERSRPEDQSPQGGLDQPKAPVQENQDMQDVQNQAPDAPPPSWKKDQPREAAGQK